jgi:WD40 repeat protein
LRRELTGNRGLVRSVALSPDGKWLASAGRDGTLQLRDAADGKPRASVSEGVLGVLVVAFRPGGKVLATGGIGSTVRLWRVAELLAKEEAILSPVEARKAVGKTVSVQMTVRAAKDRLEKRGEIYLDADTDFKSKTNFAFVITRAGARSLKKAGIGDPAKHYKGKKVRARGKVKAVEGVPRIEVDDARQIQVVE